MVKTRLGLWSEPAVSCRTFNLYCLGFGVQVARQVSSVQVSDLGTHLFTKFCGGGLYWGFAGGLINPGKSDRSGDVSFEDLCRKKVWDLWVWWVCGFGFWHQISQFILHENKITSKSCQNHRHFVSCFRCYSVAQVQCLGFRSLGTRERFENKDLDSGFGLQGVLPWGRSRLISMSKRSLMLASGLRDEWGWRVEGWGLRVEGWGSRVEGRGVRAERWRFDLELGGVRYHFIKVRSVARFIRICQFLEERGRACVCVSVWVCWRF